MRMTIRAAGNFTASVTAAVPQGQNSFRWPALAGAGAIALALEE
jgi:hypothetical protein